jgi:transposase
LRSDRKARPEGLRTGDGRALPTRLKAAIIRELRHLELALQMIAQIEAEHDVRECAISPTAP